MAIYAVHSPALDRDPAKAFDRAAAVRQGFARWAFVFGPLWLIANALWLALAVWIILAAGVVLAVLAGVLTPPAAALLYLLGDVYLGLAGPGLRGAALEFRGAPLADIVGAVTREDAEREFLSRALNAPAPTPVAAARPAPMSSASSIIGLFPEAGR